MMSQDEIDLHKCLSELNQDLGGDVAFLPPVQKSMVSGLEEKLGWQLPSIVSFFYTKEANGLIIDDKRIYSIYQKSSKKTWVENLERMNIPTTSPWFKGRPTIFQDYFILGSDQGIIFCYSKKYDLPNPALYICKNPNNPKGVDFERLDLDLAGLIRAMHKLAF